MIEKLRVREFPMLRFDKTKNPNEINHWGLFLSCLEIKM